MSKEQYENLITLLKIGLEFYADEKNYDLDEDNQLSKIELDKGVQARFSLNKIKELREIMDKTDKDYHEMINDSTQGFDSPETINNIINQMKKI